MFCTKCGAQNPDGAAFCVSCGNSLQAAGVQAQYAQPMAYQQANVYPQKRISKGLMIGLIIGGVALLAGVVVLVVVLTGGGAAANGIVGTWYDQSGYVGTLSFNSNGTVDMTAMGQKIPGEYTYDPNTKSGKITIMGQPGEFYVENGLLNLDGVVYTKEFVKQMDFSDLNLPDSGLNLPDLDLSDLGPLS